MNVWFVYMVRTAKLTLYTGISTDVDRRLDRHAAGCGSKFLRGRSPLTVVYRRRIGDHGLALAVERRLKALTKTKKESIVDRAPSRARLLRILQLDPSSCRISTPRGGVASRENAGK
jgi:putative endonuclease